MRRAGAAAFALLAGWVALAAPTARGLAQTDPREELLRRLAGQSETPPEGEEITGALLEGTLDPDAYRVGPGDRFRVQASGRATFDVSPRVDPEGTLPLGEFGAVDLRGLTLAEARRSIVAHLGARLRNTDVEVHLRELRTFKVYVLGQVRSPGAYPANGAMRASEAIALADGPLDSASVRGIRILRAGEAAPRAVDLVPFRISGDLERNPALTDGDRIVVPRRSRVFNVAGEVEHPGTYDLREGETLADAFLWIGLRPGADSTRATIARFREAIPGGTGDRFDTLSVPLSRVLRGEEPFALADGDRILVRRRPRFHEAFAVRIEGEVRFPGAYPIQPGRDRLSDVIVRAGGFLPEALPARVALIRPAHGGSVAFRGLAAGLPAGTDLTATERDRLRLETSPDSHRMTVDRERGEDVLLADGDRIVVPRATGLVRVAGEVARPGLYPHVPGDGPSDYVAAAGGGTKQADRSRTRLVRGAEGTTADADRAGRIEPGDIVYVPEKPRRSRWELTKEIFGVLAQVATVVIVIDQATR